jgi:site-specific recombinase XerC
MQSTTTLSAVTDVSTLAPRWARSLEAANLSPRRGRTTPRRCASSQSSLVERGMPTDVHSLTREHVEAFIVHLLDEISTSTAARATASFSSSSAGWWRTSRSFRPRRWRRCTRPRSTRKQVPVIDREDVRKLLGACAGRAFEDRRDTAIIRMFIGTGARLAEVANLRVDDLDLDHREANVVGKGRRFRTLALTPR